MGIYSMTRWWLLAVECKYLQIPRFRLFNEMTSFLAAFYLISLSDGVGWVEAETV